MMSLSTVKLFLILGFPFFLFIPISQSGKLAYGSKLKRTIIYQISMGVILAILYKSYSIFIFQIAIVLSQILLVYSIVLRTNFQIMIAAHAEKFVLTGVVVLILLSALPFKALIILALVGNRGFTYFLIQLREHLSKNKVHLLDKYLIYLMCIIYYIALYWVCADATNTSESLKALI